MQMSSWNKLKAVFSGSSARSSGTDSERDRRIGVRRPQRLLQGYIYSERMAASKLCTIRNVSTSGARVELLNGPVKSHMLKGVLSLYFPADKKEIDCEVIWQGDRGIGLRFVGSYRAPTRRYGGEAELSSAGYKKAG